MPVTDDGYVQLTEAEIYDQRVQAFKNETNEDIPVRDHQSVTQDNATPTLLEGILLTESRLIAENQEESLDELYDSGYIETATGQALTRRCSDIGINRRPAIPATGVVKFESNAAVSSDSPIQSGTVVQTSGTDSIDFATTSLVTIDGPETKTDSNTYSTGNTSFASQTTVSFDPSFRDSVDVSADIRTTNSSYTAYIEIVDVTNSTTIASSSTTSTSFVQVGPTAYDVSSINDHTGDDITIEYRIRIGNSSGSAELTDSQVDLPGQSGEWATIEAEEGGAEGNVGPDTITTMPSPPTNVSTVTNPWATGDPTISNTNNQDLVVGQGREEDDDLRERALRSTAIGGAGTKASIVTAVRETDGVLSATIFENTSDSTSNGLPPTSGEVVVFGGTDKAVGNTIFDVAPFTGELTNGVNGNATSYDVESDTLGQTETIRFSRAVEVNLELDIDLRTDGTYEGDVAVKNALVDLIGGEDTNGDETIGQSTINQPTYLQTIEDSVIGDELGVIGVASMTADKDGDGTDDRTTVNGLEAIEVSSGEILQVNASDIAVTTTEI